MRTTSGWWLVALGSFSFVVLAPLVTLGVVGVVNELRLARDGRITDGWVVQRDRENVRYRIRVGDAEYTHADVTGQTSLWTSLDAEGFVELRRRGVLSVRYLPADPWVNRPVHAGAMPLGDPLSVACIFGTCGVGGVVLLTVGAWRIRRGRRASTPRAF